MMIGRQEFEENAVELIADIGSFEASASVIVHAYGGDEKSASQQFQKFVEAQGWTFTPDKKRQLVHVERNRATQ